MPFETNIIISSFIDILQNYSMKFKTEVYKTLSTFRHVCDMTKLCKALVLIYGHVKKEVKIEIYNWFVTIF